MNPVNGRRIDLDMIILGHAAFFIGSKVSTINRVPGKRIYFEVYFSGTNQLISDVVPDRNEKGLG